jgi:hypothetical protein
MAKLHEEVVVLKISRLLRDGEQQDVILNDDMQEALGIMAEQLLGEAAGGKFLIEVQALEA